MLEQGGALNYLLFHDKKFKIQDCCLPCKDEGLGNGRYSLLFGILFSDVTYGFNEWANVL